MIKKYALVSTSYWDADEWKSFYIIRSSLTEEDILKIKFYANEYSRLWKECYEQESENAKNKINKDLRTDLQIFLNKRIIDTDFHSIKHYYEEWTNKDLIIEHYEFE